MTVFGWDASDYDWGRGPMDYAAAYRDGIRFATHKATEGTTWKHARYGEALRRARDAGMPLLGAYVVPRTPGNGGAGSIAAQTQYFLSYVESQTPWWRTFGGWFWQVDLEHWYDDGVLYDAVAPSYGVEMCRRLRSAIGKQVVLYAPGWAYRDSIPDDGTPLWESDYGANPSVPYRQAYPGDGSSRWASYSGRTPAILQFGSRTTIGTQPICDANAFRGTLAELTSLLTGDDDMQLTDPVPSAATADVPNRNVDQVLGDLWTGVHQRMTDQFKAIRDRLTALEARPPVQPAPVDVAALAAQLSPLLEAAAERAVRKVLGAVDGATPQA